MRRIGRYVLHDEIASGGMATVHLGRILGDEGFKRTVAIKRLHPHVAASPDALDMFIDEATLSAHVRHRNVVTTLDVVRADQELFLVLEYVHGVPLALLVRRAKERRERLPLPVASAIMIDALEALDAVHQTKDELGRALSIVHRDVSPQNILVGVDGSARMLDFGIAKAAVRLQTTRDDQLKGKLRYMAPEQLMDAKSIDGRTDQFAAGSVLWGVLTGEVLFDASSEAAVLARVLEGVILPPSRYAREVPPALDAVVLKALARPPDERFPTCRAMADALREALPPATPDEVRSCVERLAGDVLHARAEQLARIEAGADATPADAPSAAAEEPTATDLVPIRGHVLDPSPPRRRGASIAWVAGAVLVAVAIGAVVVSRAGSTTPPTETTPVHSPTPPIGAPDETAVASSSAVAPAAEPPSSAIPTSAPSGSSRSVRRPRPPSRASGGHPAPRCAQMYSVDSDGIRRVKPECL